MKTDSLNTIAAVAHKTTYAGAAGGFWGWLTANATLGLIGALVALGGFVVNWYYKRKADARAVKASALAAAESALRQEERRMRIALLKNQVAQNTPEVQQNVLAFMETVPNEDFP